MLENVTLEEAQSKLPEIIESLKPGAEVVITRDNQPVAALHLPAGAAAQPRYGSCRGALTILAEDDEHLQDFKDYMPSWTAPSAKTASSSCPSSRATLPR
jgi:antitoxin (DNA-binding transcriptional repressor) of toxin-antitoxin stability system